MGYRFISYKSISISFYIVSIAIHFIAIGVIFLGGNTHPLQFLNFNKPLGKRKVCLSLKSLKEQVFQDFYRNKDGIKFNKKKLTQQLEFIRKFGNYVKPSSIEEMKRYFNVKEGFYPDSPVKGKRFDLESAVILDMYVSHDERGGRKFIMRFIDKWGNKIDIYLKEDEITEAHLFLLRFFKIIDNNPVLKQMYRRLIIPLYGKMNLFKGKDKN